MKFISLILSYFSQGTKMGVWADMKQWTILHLLLGYVFLGSGFIICFLMLVTYICVWPISKTLYRKIIYNLAYSHWSREFIFSYFHQCSVIQHDVMQHILVSRVAWAFQHTSI